jgi:hypothetical protein
MQFSICTDVLRVFSKGVIFYAHVASKVIAESDLEQYTGTDLNVYTAETLLEFKMSIIEPFPC